MEQIQSGNKRVYLGINYPLQSLQLLASNTSHYLIQQGLMTISEGAELKPLMDSEDSESVRLALYIMDLKHPQI